MQQKLDLSHAARHTLLRAPPSHRVVALRRKNQPNPWTCTPSPWRRRLRARRAGGGRWRPACATRSAWSRWERAVLPWAWGQPPRLGRSSLHPRRRRRRKRRRETIPRGVHAQGTVPSGAGARCTMHLVLVRRRRRRRRLFSKRKRTIWGVPTTARMVISGGRRRWHRPSARP
jgi:hypothetical protein